MLNPYAAATCPTGFDEFELFPEDDQPVRLAYVHATWLAELGAVFEIVWASGWGCRANALVGPILGVAGYDHVRFPPMPFEPGEKLPAVASYVRDRSVAWLDDVVLPSMQRWAGERAAPTLLVAVDPAVGLTREHVDALVLWEGDLPGSRDPRRPG